MEKTILMQNKGKESLPVYIFFQLFHLQLILFWLLPSGFFFFCRASRNSLQEPFFPKSFWLWGRKTKTLATDRKKSYLKTVKELHLHLNFRLLPLNYRQLLWAVNSGESVRCLHKFSSIGFAVHIVFTINSLIWNYFLCLIERRV